MTWSEHVQHLDARSRLSSFYGAVSEFVGAIAMPEECTRPTKEF